ncbi:MAG: alpha/beta hydrolase [Deltaproteobacteria bacterium]
MTTKEAEYYRRIYLRLNENIPQKLTLNMNVKGAGDTILQSSLFDVPSNIGIIIIPGLTVPRESYFKLLHSFSHYKTLLFDLRGQADSEGEVDYDKCVADINIIGNWFKNKYKLKYLIGVGHSFGGLCLLKASMDRKHAYDLRISLAPPFDMSHTTSGVPKYFTKLFIYLYNSTHWLTNKPYRDEIFQHKQSYKPHEFVKNPYVGALKLNGHNVMSRIITMTPKLADFISDIALPSYLIYGNNDKRIGGEEYFKEQYEILNVAARNRGFDLCLMHGLSHRFNLEPEKEFVLSYNNNEVIRKINSIIERHK